MVAPATVVVTYSVTMVNLFELSSEVQVISSVKEAWVFGEVK